MIRAVSPPGTVHEIIPQQPDSIHCNFPALSEMSHKGHDKISFHFRPVSSRIS